MYHCIFSSASVTLCHLVMCVCVCGGGGRRHQYESLDSLIMPDSYVWYVWLAISLLQIVG